MTAEEIENMKNQGDPGSTAEELAQGVDPIEEKCRVICLAVNEDFFTIEEALEAYGVSLKDWAKYLLKRFNNIDL